MNPSLLHSNYIVVRHFLFVLELPINFPIWQNLCYLIMRNIIKMHEKTKGLSNDLLAIIYIKHYLYLKILEGHSFRSALVSLIKEDMYCI